MSLGLAGRQGVLTDDVVRFCDETLSPSSIYGLLHRERDVLFPDEFFADLFSERGRRSVPPSVVATVMVLQRLEGLSDREAAERYCFDARWRYASGVGGYDTGGWGRFAHTVLVDMRARLAATEKPRRIFEVVLEAAGGAGLLGARRVLDSTPLYDAVATMDTVTLIRSALRQLLEVADAGLETELRAVLVRDDDYRAGGKPVCDWDDKVARDDLVDALARDGYAALVVLEGRELDAVVAAAGELLATVLGQDLETSEDGVFGIARRVAPDRVISIVDPEARHGHKTSARGFDGYKGHVAVDPDSEIITDTTVTPGNAGDASVAADLIDDLLAHDATDNTADTAIDDTTAEDTTAEDTTAEDTTAEDTTAGEDEDFIVWFPENLAAEAEAARAADAADNAARAAEDATAGENQDDESPRPKVYGDAAYGSGEFQSLLEDARIDSGCRTQSPVAAGGHFPKDRFDIDLEAGTVTCPAEVTVTLRRHRDATGTASFGDACKTCPLAEHCTTSKSGRTISVTRHEATLARARSRQANPEWKDDYRATRPKVERKLGHLMRRKHGGRRARVRGTTKVDADFNLLGAAVNIARVAVAGIRSDGNGGWAVTA
jgi:hypothetical protein